MLKGYFIAGTDTGIGKTTAAALLLNQLNAEGKRTIGLKPVASGCDATAQGLRNADALILQQHASVTLPYDTINPYAFAPPIAPHIAAQASGVTLSVNDLVQKCQKIQRAHPTSTLLIEGVGGWCVPLNDQETMADFASALGLPVILVVGMRLGCINHTLLTWASIKQAGVPTAGWIANQIDPNLLAYQENIQTLKSRLDAPLRQVIPYTAIGARIAG